MALCCFSLCWLLILPLSWRGRVQTPSSFRNGKLFCWFCVPFLWRVQPPRPPCRGLWARCDQHSPSQPHVGCNNLSTPEVAQSHPSALFPSLSTFSWPNLAQVLHPKPQLPKEPCHSKEEEAGEMSSVLWLALRVLSLSFPFREFITLSDGWNGLEKGEDGHGSLE